MRTIFVLLCICILSYIIESANIHKFLERDIFPRTHMNYRRNLITTSQLEENNKLTKTLYNTDNRFIDSSSEDIPDTPDTPEMDVDTPDTPESASGFESSSGNDEDDGSSGYSKKSKIFHKSKNVSVKSDIKSAKVSKDVAKKQYLGVPASPASQREGLGGEPVGDLNAEGGLGGLGGDMGGIPTGMGAGAEPLGAFENNNEGQQQAPENEGAPNQGVEEEGQQPIAAFNKAEKPNEGEQGNPEMFHDEVGNGPGVRPMDKEEMNDGPPGLNQGMNINAPQPDMTESMTNNIAAMDKANIQGDSEVAEMVRQYAKGKDSFNTSPYEPQIPQRPEAQFSKEFGKGDEMMGARFNDDAAKRRLVKTHHKKKAHKFKKLQRH